MARVREEVFNIPSENHWEKGNKEVIEKSTQTEVSVADKETQTEELGNKDIEERITRLEKMERILSAHIQIPPK